MVRHSRAIPFKLKLMYLYSQGSERFLYSLLGRLENDIGIIFACLSALRLDPGVRVKAGDALVPPKDMRVNELSLLV
jgi:hypothetical protein